MIKSTPLHVLVTRPAAQSQELCTALHALHVVPVVLPTLKISSTNNPAPLQAVLAKLPEADLVIFISPNAVHYGLAALSAGARSRLTRCKIAAIGLGTAKCLAAQGLPVNLLPATHYSSEGLLELPELQCLQRQLIIIFAGNEGRPVLADTLQQRGATVLKACVYQRSAPVHLAEQLAGLTVNLDLIISTSAQGLSNLWQAARQLNKDLSEIPLLVSSERLKLHAQEFGFQQILVAENAGCIALTKALANWKKNYDQTFAS